VVTFDAHAAGTSAEEWNDWHVLTDAAPLSLEGVARAVVVAAHADDETLGAGGLIAALAARGVDLTIVIATDGAASHPQSPTHTPAQVAELRRREAEAAIESIAPAADLAFLDVGDGATIGREDDIRAGIAARLRGADLVVAPWRGDGHRDHRVVGEVAAQLASERGIRLLEYPVWMWHWGSPGAAGSSEIAWSRHPLSSDAIEAKRRAIDAYPSQTRGLGDEMGNERALEAEFLVHFERPVELFVETAATAATGAPAMGEPYFDDLYRLRSDPWRLESRWYEERKRHVTMASLPARRYGAALEIGTSIGMLTAELAGRCDALLSLDISRAAVEAARARLAGRDNVTIEHRDAVTDFPTGEFDLIVISEVGYYWSREALELIADTAAAALSADGALVLCHWRHPVEDYLLTGDEVHAIVVGRVDLPVVASHEEADFRLDVLSRDARSVAQREGFIE